MKRRDFLTVSAQSAFIAQLASGCSLTRSMRGSRHLVDTPEKRAGYLEEMLEKLCTDIGPHPIGSPQYDQAARIVWKEMKRSLPVVGMDTFTFERWVLSGDPELFVGGAKLDAYICHGTSGTPPEGITGFVKRIDEDGIPYGVVDRSTGEIRAYIIDARYDKAVPLPYYSFGKPVKCLPAFNIGKTDIPVIEKAIEAKIPVRMKAIVEFIPVTPTANVAGMLPGNRREEILFIAHLDTVYNSQGANDNTASLIIMLMLAHAFTGTRPEKTLRFLATTGEEYNKLGAVNYAEKRRKDGSLRDIRYIVNFDSLTWGTTLKIYTEDDELRSLIGAIDRELDLPGTPELNDSDGFQLDARPFRETGARAMYVNSIGYPNTLVWHRPEDVPDTVPVECMETGFRMFSEYINRVMKM
ncbi:M28 family metallopeptidase [bacterium]|nr:M28 family metallopeptidase [bacterium]